MFLTTVLTKHNLFKAGNIKLFEWHPIANDKNSDFGP